MRLSSQNSQFVFNLPSDFLPGEIIPQYAPILEKNHIQYENIIDYLNSTIKAVNFPGIGFEAVKQIYPRGKEKYYKPAKNVQDIITTRELTVTFRSVDSDLNYWLMFDIVTKHYLDVEELYVHPFSITCVDIHRDGIYRLNFKQLIIKTLFDNTFNYSAMRVTAKEFTMTFMFNFYDIEFLLDNRKVLELGSLPTIIQKI